jgi:GH15 family glucan-1,4-alpha-glucosidase
VMAWTAADRAVRAVEDMDLDGPVDDWKRLREEIHDEVCDRGFDARRGTFTQYYGSKELDAALLLIPAVGFLPARDRRVAGTVAAIERELCRDGVVQRYTMTKRSERLDGLPPGEGAFLPCSFWLAAAYVLAGRRDDGRALFERLLGLRTDLGLLSEEYDVDAGRLIGNFPQALSHLALVNTAFDIAAGDGPHRRARSHHTAGPR